jgi:hypothetical protein
MFVSFGLEKKDPVTLAGAPADARSVSSNLRRSWRLKTRN